MSGAEGITAYVQTRNATTDYRFVVSPSVRWWRDYLKWTQAERPSLLLIPSETPNQWKLYASAIPSTRRDYRQTPIRYTFVLEGITPKNAEFISQFIRTWFTHTREPENHVEAARALDRDFSQEFLADAFASDALDAEQHHAYVIKTVVEWTNNTEVSEDALNDVVRLKDGEWAGVEAKGARSAFLQWIKEALREERAPTAAFVFNATSVDSEVDELLHRFKGDFIVLRWNDESPPSAIKKKPLQVQLVEKTQEPKPTPMLRPLLIALAILAVMVIVVKGTKKETATVLWGPTITLDQASLADLPELPQKICHHRTPLAKIPHLALTKENQVILHVPTIAPK